MFGLFKSREYYHNKPDKRVKVISLKHRNGSRETLYLTSTLYQYLKRALRDAHAGKPGSVHLYDDDGWVIFSCSYEEIRRNYSPVVIHH